MRRSLPFLFATALLAGPAQAADVATGKEIHDANCVSCHTSLMDGEPSRIYTREDRKVDSLARLESQVRMCDSSLGLKLFDEDIMSLVAYLNQEFYKF